MDDVRKFTENEVLGCTVHRKHIK